MSYMYNRPRRPAPPNQGRGQRPITPADIENFVRAYDEQVRVNEAQQKRLEELSKTLQNTKSELEITKEALHKQSEEFKKVETELVFTRAAFEDAQKKLQAPEESPEEQTWQEKYVRLQAEVDNLRKRWEQKATGETAEARRKILNDMLPLADHLDLALQHAPAGEDAALKGFLANIDATRRAFLETLRRYGVERVDPQGQPFDPNLHEAIGHAPMPGVPADHVAQVVQAGYVEGDRVIRPARVLVSAG
jgi:molecular chaperone GrpE